MLILLYPSISGLDSLAGTELRSWHYLQMNIERRELLVGAGALLATVTAGKSMAVAAGNAGPGGQAPPTPTAIVFENAIALRARGETCVAFCLKTVATNPSLAECGRSAQEMLAVNGAVEGLAVLESGQLKAVA